MPPSLEVVTAVHELDFDDAILKASASEELEITETESSDTGDAPTPTDSGADGSRVIDGEDWNHITKPGTHDVLLGRGGGTNNHSGNIKFRKLVNEHKMRYLACSKVEKPKVARQVVGLWRKMEPTGRFLARKDESKRGPGSVKATDNVWFEVGDKKAREKASQCLRERTPDVIPYIKHLREQQNAITEQGVSMVQMQMQQQEQMMHTPHGAPHGAMPMAHPHHAMHHQHHPQYGFDPSQAQYNNHYRRNSMPNQHHGMPVAPMGTNGFAQPPPRRSSCAAMPINPEPFSPTGPSMEDPSADMSEMEYQQQMMMMQQQMQMQQMQMQRMQQNRMRMRMGPGGAGGVMDNNTNNGGFNNNNGMMGVQPNDHQQYDPIVASSNGAIEQQQRSSEAKNKRSRGDGDKPTAPDRTTSLMSLTPANADDHELSLEDYRQQLEEYIANTNKDDDDGEDSDLEDDWEKERERAIRQQESRPKTRGVSRNMSGMSCVSAKSGMSLVSGFSGFSDMNMSKKSQDNREGKMNMARSVSSNLSLMSELTDLSQNIDNLSIYDD